MATTPAAVMQVVVTANTAGANAALKRTQAQLKGTAAAGSTMGSRLATAAKAGAVGVAALGGVSVKMAVDFDRSMRNVNSIAQLSERRLASLSNQVRELAGKTAQSPQTLAEGLYDLVSSGFDADESMKVLSKSARAATAGLTTTEVSTKAVAAALNAYRLPAKQAGKVSDIMFRTVDRGVISFETLAGSIGMAMPASAALGVKLDALGAGIATLTKQGQSGESAVVNLNAAMTSLFKPTEAMKTSLKDLGYENAEALIAAEGFQGGLQALVDTTDGTTAAVGELFSNVRAQRAVFGLTGKNAADAASDLRGLEDSAGATSLALSQQSKSVAYMWNKLKAQASSLAIGIGNELLPDLKEMISIVSNPKLTMSEKFAGLGDKLADIVREWAPKLVKAGVMVGGALVKGIWGAIKDQSTEDKVDLAAILGGYMVIRASGAAIGRVFGKSFGKGAVIGLILAAPALLKEWYNFVADHRTEIKNWGIGAGEWFVNGIISAINAGLREIFNPDGALWQALSALPGGGVVRAAFEAVGPSAPQIDPVHFDRIAEAATSTEVPLKNLIANLDKAAKKGKEAADANSKSASSIYKDLTKTGNQAKSTGTVWDHYQDIVQKSTRSSSDAVKKHRRGADQDMSAVDRSMDKGRDSVDRYSTGAGESFGKLTNKSARAARGVAGNNSSMVNAVGSGLGTLRDNLNKALHSFQVKQVAYSIKNVSKSVGNLMGAQKGAIVPGASIGDNHTLALNGVPIAKVESGEQISVLNKKATKHLMELNSRIPRFATGGMVDPAGPGTGVVNKAIAPVVGAWSTKYNAAINYGYDPGGGHVSPGHNVTGTATDTGPAAGWGAGPTALFEQGLRAVLSAGLTVLYGSHGIGTPYPNHGYGNHAHIEWGMHPSLKGISGASLETLAKIALQGPDGTLKSLGQRVLDMAHKGASSYLAKNSSGAMGGDIGAPIRSLPKALQKYNRQYPEAPAPSHLTAYHMPFNAVAALAEWAGSPGVSMAKTAIGESALAPGATGIDPGGASKGWGLQMITTGVGNDAMINELGGPKSMLNPVINEQAAARILDSSGWGAWYSQTKDTSNTHYTGPLLKQRGGLVGLQGGGILNLTKTIGKLMDPGPTKGKAEKKYDDAKHDRDIIKNVHDRIKKLTKGKNYPTKGGELTGRLEELRGLADQYSEWSNYASDFGKPFHGKDAAGWKKMELQTLGKLRNQLLIAERAIAEQQKEVERLVKDAAKRQRDFEKRAKEAQRVLDKDGKTPKGWKGPDPASGDIKKWNALKDNERLKMAHKFLKDGRLPGDRKFLEDGSLATFKSHPELFPDVKGLGGVARFLKGTVLGGLKGSSGIQGTLAGSMRTLEDELKTVQGTGFTHKLLDTIKYGQLGGQIFDAQRTLREFTATSNQVNGFSIQDVLDIAEAVKYNVFDQFPRAHSGAHIVGSPSQEFPVIARGGESIVPTENLSPNVTVVVKVADGMGWLKDFISVEIDEHDDDYATISRTGVS